MKICGVIRPKSTKIVVEFDNYDFTDEAMEEINQLFYDNKLPIHIEEPTDLDLESFSTYEYPVEKLLETLVNHSSGDGTIKDVMNLITVASSIANIIEDNVRELEGAPLTINVNMDSWLDKPAGYNKEIDDT